MCDLDKTRGTFRIDPCLVEFINELRIDFGIETLASCCGHGKYNPTIIYKNAYGEIVEFYTKILLENEPRKSHKYYKKDKDGYYYIPELQPKEGFV